jgi:uncharacterized protein (TIGR03663 family)
MRRGAFYVALLVIAAGALALRLPALGNRPMHADESVHAVKFSELWKSGVYRYDPNEFHGPTLYYATLPVMWLKSRHDFADTQESDYRLAIALFGAGLVLLPGLLADGLGRRAALWSSLLTVVSTAFVFYSRYYIQETPLAFFTLGMIACGWRYARSHRPGWLLVAGLCAGLMVATKETAVLAFGALALALWLSVIWSRRVDGHAPDIRRLWNAKFATLALGIGLLTACLFLSGFFSNPRGPLDYLRAYTPWLRRAGDTGLHQHPWHYYLRLLLWTRGERGPVWSEGLIVGLAVVGLVAALLPQRKSKLEGSAPLARLIVFYTLTLTIAYSVIPYKTPWCVLSFLNGMILLAGLGAEWLLKLTPGKPLKAVISLLLLAGCAQLGRQAYQASFLAYADADNPYVYAQTVPDALNLEHRIEDLARASSQHDNMLIKVFSVDTYTWPLPWYLRRFPNVGYWTQVTQDAAAPVVIASPEFDDALSKKLDSTHLMIGYYGLRPGTLYEVWVRMNLWANYLKIHKPPNPDQ